MNMKKKRKKIGKLQTKKLRAAIVMALVCVLMLSGATYAWFTLGNTARVNSLSLQVSSEGKLYIGSTEGELGNKKTEISLASNDTQILYPCTTDATGKTMYSPKYESDKVVNGAEEIKEAQKKDYYYEKDIWLKVEETGKGSSANEYAITLAKNAGEDGGTFVKAKSGASGGAENCVRVSFTVNGNVSMYEPNNASHNNGDKATDKSGKKYTGAIHKQGKGGTFEGEQGTVYYSGDSSELFKIKANTPTKVTIRVWFEGTDNDCTNDIQNAQITSQLKFVSHKITK